MSTGIKKIEIYDYMGRIVKSQIEDNISCSISDIPVLLKGVYLFRILKKRYDFY